MRGKRGPPSRADAARRDPSRDASSEAPDDRARPAIPEFSPSRIVGTALRETYQSFASALSAGLAAGGLTITMWFVLRTLWDDDGLSQSVLAERINLSPAAIVKLVNQLVDLGLVVRRRGTDRRVSHIFLTQKAHAIRRATSAAALQTDARALRGFSAAEAACLLEMLSRLRANLNDKPA